MKNSKELLLLISLLCFSILGFYSVEIYEYYNNVKFDSFPLSSNAAPYWLQQIRYYGLLSTTLFGSILGLLALRKVNINNNSGT